MIGHIEHVRTESGYLVWCSECHEKFESKRNDAAYCGATCRSRAHRREKQRAVDLINIEYHTRKVIANMPRSGKSKEFNKLLQIRAEIDRALSWVESD